MYALLINGSPHAAGCTYTALSEVAKALEEDGIKTEILHVGNKNIRGCIACRSCQKTGKCVFDDMVNETAAKLEKADAVIVGSPVYYAAPAGTLISFLDRLFYSTSAVDKRMKVGASVVSCRRGGNSSTFDVLNKYFTISNMPVAASQYWNMVYGTNAEEVKMSRFSSRALPPKRRKTGFPIPNPISSRIFTIEKGGKKKCIILNSTHSCVWLRREVSTRRRKRHI